MAFRGSNRRRNLWVVEQLQVRPADHVLEIGFGPGLAVQALAARITSGSVCGLDHSERMLAMARRRNAAAVRAGIVDLRLGSIEDAAGFGRLFDKALLVNVVQFWDDPGAALQALGRRLRPGGCVAVALQPRWRGATAADTARSGEKIASTLVTGGYRQVRIETLPLRPIPVVCVLATVGPTGASPESSSAR
jgi:SAM-dependent methyltransferase